MSDGCFIDGLQTRAERARRNAQTKNVTTANGDPLAMQRRRMGSGKTTTVGARRSSQVWSDQYAGMASASPRQTRRNTQARKTEDYLAAIGAKMDADEKKPARKRRSKDFLQQDAPRPSEAEYRRKVLGFSDDDLEMDLDSDDLRKKKKKNWWKMRKGASERKMSKRRKVSMAVAGVVILLLGGAYVWGDSIISRITGGNSGLIDLLRSAVLSDGNAKFKTGENGRTNILLFGTSGYDMKGSEGDDIHDGAQLTDSIMVLSLNQESKDVALVSVQRDLLVGGGCGGAGKINEVYSCANPYGDNEAAGADALKKKVGEVLGMDLQYYVHMDWMALISIVDALDGITVTLDEDIDDSWTETHIKAGEPTKLNGERALGLARARHGTVGGDFSRANSQQKILVGLKSRVLERGFSLTELLNVAAVMGDNFRTDFNAEEIAAGAKLAVTTDLNTMRQVSLLGTEAGDLLTDKNIRGVSYIVPTAGERNYDALKDYIAKQLSGKKAEDASILVLNGSGVTGIAAAEQKELEGSGFKVARIGDAPAGEYFEAYSLYSLNDTNPDTKEKLEKYYNTKAVGADVMPAGIDTEGVDFVVILGVGYQ